MDLELDSESQLKSIRGQSLDELKITHHDWIPADLAPPPLFWASYNNVALGLGLRACLAVWKASKHEIVPNEFQLKATIAMISGQDSLIDAGCKGTPRFNLTPLPLPTSLPTVIRLTDNIRGLLN